MKKENVRKMSENVLLDDLGDSASMENGLNIVFEKALKRENGEGKVRFILSFYVTAEVVSPICYSIHPA